MAEPDLPALQAASDAATLAHEAALSEAATLRERAERLDRLARDCRSAAELAAAQEAECGVVGHVAAVARGLEAPNISFQRFVLAALLDEVLSSATERLLRMSRGRYQLVRSAQAGRRNVAAGLDLLVVDSYTGSTRPVATLSGGESFLAALALSLGLADVVQCHSGGIRLDTLFVDEGFGSLDPDALELALDTLTSLKAEGRLVGIISHVPELRARIASRLEIVPGPRGSTTRLVVG